MGGTILAAMSRAVELMLGLMLLAIGLLVLASEPLGNWFSGLGISEELLAWWPAIVVILSAFFLLPAALPGPNRRLRAGMVIPGAFLAGVGGALLYTSLNDRWDAWSYLWTVIPFSIGIGLYAAGWIADLPAFKWIGSGMAVGAAIAYLAFATAFGGETFRLIGSRGHHRAGAGAGRGRAGRSAEPQGDRLALVRRGRGLAAPPPSPRLRARQQLLPVAVETMNSR